MWGKDSSRRIASWYIYPRIGYHYYGLQQAVGIEYRHRGLETFGQQVVVEAVSEREYRAQSCMVEDHDFLRIGQHVGGYVAFLDGDAGHVACAGH